VDNTNIFKPQQDWSFIDKWFDDYGHTLEPREIARWAYSNGTWKVKVTDDKET
jgi:hypothetical protein